MVTRHRVTGSVDPGLVSAGGPSVLDTSPPVDLTVDLTVIVVDGTGRAWVDTPGLMPWEDPKPGIVAVVLPDGTSRQVAEDLWFPNGMAVLRNGTLVVAESHADRLSAWTITDSGELVDRRVWADLGPGAAPDGICARAEGAIWYASVPAKPARELRPRVGCSRRSKSIAAALHVSLHASS
jgi:sugar lactone lactonase YvrE